MFLFRHSGQVKRNPRFYRDKSSSSYSRSLQKTCTPFSNGVTTFYQAINMKYIKSPSINLVQQATNTRKSAVECIAVDLMY